MTLKETLLASAKKAKTAMEAMERCGEGDGERFSALLREYILAKYLLDGGEEEEDLERLSHLSVERVVRLAAEPGFSYTDVPGCTGQSSATEKKILLLLKIRDTLEKELPVEELIGARTLPRLAQVIFAARFGKRGQNGR